MRKTVLLLLLVLIGIFFLLTFIKNKVGDIRPALLPSKTIEQQTKQVKPGEPVSFPLQLPSGFHIGIFAKDLGNARDLAFSPQGTLLLSIPASSKIVALPDKNSDGKADETRNVLTNLDRPHGIAFHNGKLFVAEETRVVRYLWDEQSLKATKEKLLFPLPKSSGHFTRTIAFDRAGRMFISIGSTCNVCFEKNEWFASIVVSDEDGNNPRLFAKGLRNSVFINVNPTTDELWGIDMGRDFLGDNLPPEEVNIIREDKDYGWPICYGKNIHDGQFDKRPFVEQSIGTIDQVRCGSKEPSMYEIAAHSAPLGSVFITSPQFPKDWQGDLLVAYHGSWNRSTPIGYKVVHMKVSGNSIVSEEDFVTGFLQGSEALARPVDLTFDKEGSLYVSDDKSGNIFKVTH